MGVMMGIMMVLMVAGLLGHGHHGRMTGYNEKEGQKEEAVVKEKATEPTGTVSEKAEDLKEEISDERNRD